MTRSSQCAQRWTVRVGAAAISFLVPLANAVGQIFNGGGLQGGVDHARGLQGISQNTNVRAVILNIIIGVLNFMALAAVIVIIISAIQLIISQGEEEAMGKAKKTIYYTLAGLAIILFARVIVGLVTVYLASFVA